MDARGGDASERPAPSGMQRGDDAAFHVNHQNGHAVGGEDAEGETGSSGDYPVAFGTNVRGATARAAFVLATVTIL